GGTAGSDPAPVTGAAAGDQIPSAEGTTAGILDAGPHIPPIPLGPDTLRRLACQALVEPATHPDTSQPAAVQHRFATARQRRALLTRDGSCAFPGCPRRRHLHAHHLQHWSDGGPTTMHNLVLTCAHHHRLVHEGGWQLRPRPDHRFDAIHPDGHIVRPAPDTGGTVHLLPSAHNATITPATVTGTWTGEPLELGYAVSVYAAGGA
ncbi:MAG: HNH endonuclease signature motif containing protein, partial [Mycobacteriales bacterium]